MKNHTRYGFALLFAVFALASTHAHADSPPPVFLSLSTAHRTIDNKNAIPLRNAQPHFIPLSQKQKFFALPHRGGHSVAIVPPHRDAPLKASAPETADASGMTKQQAHQILSLFPASR